MRKGSPQEESPFLNGKFLRVDPAAAWPNRRVPPGVTYIDYGLIPDASTIVPYEDWHFRPSASLTRKMRESDRLLLFAAPIPLLTTVEGRLTAIYGSNTIDGHAHEAIMVGLVPPLAEPVRKVLHRYYYNVQRRLPVSLDFKMRLDENDEGALQLVALLRQYDGVLRLPGESLEGVTAEGFAVFDCIGTLDFLFHQQPESLEEALRFGLTNWGNEYEGRRARSDMVRGAALLHCRFFKSNREQPVAWSDLMGTLGGIDPVSVRRDSYSIRGAEEIESARSVALALAHHCSNNLEGKPVIRDPVDGKYWSGQNLRQKSWAGNGSGNGA